MQVWYHDDMDGKAAAYVVRSHVVGGEHRFFPMQYAKEPPLDEVNAGEEVWIVDFRLQKPGDWKRLLAITPDVTWIDHHKTAIEAAAGTPAEKLRGLRREGREAGCLLVWEFMHGHFPPPPYALQLVSDRDTWAWEHGNETAYFHAGASLADTDPLSPFWDAVVADRDDTIARVLEQGQTIVRFKQQFYADLRRAIGFVTSIDGHPAFALNVARVGSEGFGFEGGWKGDLPAEYPVLMPFYWDGAKYTVSLYSKSVDVSEIAKRRAGGGHPGAAGFQAEKLPPELCRSKPN